MTLYSGLVLPLLFCCVLLFIDAVSSQECNEDLMRRCQTDGLDAIDSSGSQFSRSDIEDQCRLLREKFNCVLWQTAMCLDKDGQDNNRDSITRMWRYLQSFCESQGNWYTKPCFQRDDLKRCESLLPSRGYSTDTSSCRSYASFRNCAEAIVQIDCSTSDQMLFGSYLMEKGQQRAWNCPKDQSDFYAASAPLSADVDSRYSSSSDVSYGYCSDRARSELQGCRSDFYASQKEAQTHNDSDMKHHITCCAMVRFENCVKQNLQDYCGDRGNSEASTIISDMKQRFPYQSCGDHTMTECSGAAMKMASFLLCIFLAMTSKFMFHKL